MTGAEAVNAWFTPFHYFVYLGTILVLLISFLQWKWSKTCQNNILILVSEQGGGGKWTLAPKEGGSVTIKNPDTGVGNTWPLNELATIDVLYPGVGFIPEFAQKTIRLAIVSEGDYEPLLNRSPHGRKVASPDIVAELTKIAEGLAEGDVKNRLSDMLVGVSTAPTRDMIGSPAVLYNVIHEGVSRLAVTLDKGITETLEKAMKRLGQSVNPTIMYIGMGLIVALLVATLYFVVGMTSMDVGTLGADVQAIKQALGVP